MNRVKCNVRSTATVVLCFAVFALAVTAAAQTNGTMLLQNLTTPRGGVWLDGALGGHYWDTDAVLGICRMDAAPAANPPWQLTNCQGAAKSGGQAIVAQPGPGIAGLPAGAKFVFVPDASTKSVNVVRYVYTPATEGLSSPLAMTVTNPTFIGGGSGGGRPVALALAPNGVDLYVGYIKSGDIMMITGATTTTSSTPPVAKIGSTSDGKGVGAMLMFKNDLYIAERGGFGLSRIADPSGLNRVACSATAPCTAVSVSPQISFFPGGLATDGNFIYVGDSPLTTPGSVLKWDPASGAVTTYSLNVTPAYTSTFDGKTRSQYVNPWGLTMLPNGDLYVGDDPSSALILAVLPTQQGHLWKVAATPQPLAVTSVSPNFGTALGGTVVTVNGTGFSTAAGATTIAFGGVAATNVSCSSITVCTATSPAGTNGATVDVQVSVTAGGVTTTSPAVAADQFTYAAVKVNSMTPAAGPASGGTIVTLTGLGFSTVLGQTQVTFGGVSATGVNCTSSTTCTAATPAYQPALQGAPAVPVVVTVNGQASATTGAPIFTYAAPTITAVAPKSGPLEGGTVVAITGTGFNPALGGTSVAFGGVAATNVSCASATSCTATSPATAAAAVVDISVTAFNLTSAATAADQFSYQSLTVSSIAPVNGPAIGGTVVTITGTGFSTAGDTTVSFGLNAGLNVTCASSTTCTATSPAGSGAVDVLVTIGTTTKFTSAATPADVFTYLGVTVSSVSAGGVTATSTTPLSILATGGTLVTVTGTGFNTTPGGTTITFTPIAGNTLMTATAGTQVTCASSTTCTVAAPVGAGTADVIVTANAQSSLAVPTDQVTFTTPVANVYAWGITAPKGGMLWVPGALGGHWWSSDHGQGFCRQDPVPATTLHAINFSICDDGSIGSPGQAVYDSRVNPAFTNATTGAAVPAGTHFIYVPDNAVKSTAVWRLTFDPTTETLVGAPEAMVPLANVRTLKPNGMALGPDGNLYITDLTEANIRQLTAPNGDPRLQTINIVAVTGDARGANGTIGFIGNRVYISENRAASWFDITQCPTATGPCATTPIPLPSGVFVAGVGTDPVHNIVYVADSPGAANANIWRYEVATNTYSLYLQFGTLPPAPAPGVLPTVYCALTCTRPWDPTLVPGGTTGFAFAFGVNVDPNDFSVFVTEDATAGARAGRGAAWRAPFVP